MAKRYCAGKESIFFLFFIVCGEGKSDEISLGQRVSSNSAGVRHAGTPDLHASRRWVVSLSCGFDLRKFGEVRYEVSVRFTRAFCSGRLTRRLLGPRPRGS